jgi:hypothetical protein
MNKIKIILAILFTLITTSVFAIDIPQNVKLDNASIDSLEISWDEVP